MAATPPRSEVDFDKLKGGPWDGRRYSYIPREPLKISPDLKMLDRTAPVDPVTYQVIRWKLWSINLEHADTIRRMSGTPVVVYMDDFATALLTGRGENLVGSPTIQYFTGLADLVVKWTLENRSENPGIEEGDIFLQNDPWVGTAHQIDTAIYGPVFHDGEIVAWVFSSCHMGDIGGATPGSFCVTARDVYDEPAPIPPIKIARNHELQADVAEMFCRGSRQPEMIALQLRSQVAGFVATRARILSIVEQYGAEVFNGVMQRMIDDCSEAVSRRLARIPDGEWFEKIYIGGAMEGDRSLLKIVTTLRKEGDQIVCSNAGTDPQISSGNATYAVWRSGLICAASAMLAYDQMQCPAGILRHLQFEPTPGLANCAIHPGAVTTLTANINSIAVDALAFSKMLLSGAPDLHPSAITAGGGAQGFWMQTWRGPNGEHLADLTGDTIACGTGASLGRDGIDQGGGWFTPANIAGDCEEWEEAMPLLYLFRKSAAGSGGAGRSRGGNGVTTAFTGRNVTESFAQLVRTDPAVNNALGLIGGRPGVPGRTDHFADRGTTKTLSEGRMFSLPCDIYSAYGTPVRIHPRGRASLSEVDAIIIDTAGCGGVGDPLLREAARVAADVNAGTYSRDIAYRSYGVVLEANGEPDAAATEERRAQVRLERLASASPPASKSDPAVSSGEVVLTVGQTMEVRKTDGAHNWCCAHCHAPLGPLEENFKNGCAVAHHPATEFEGGRYEDPATFGDYVLEYRDYLCPGCGTVLAMEHCRPEDEPMHDFRIRLATN